MRHLRTRSEGRVHLQTLAGGCDRPFANSLDYLNPVYQSRAAVKTFTAADHGAQRRPGVRDSSYSWAVQAACPCYDEPRNLMTLPAPVPEIPAADVDKAAGYYVDILGFTFGWGDDQGGIAASRGGI